MKLKVEMTLTAETAKKLQETGERLAVMNLGDDGMLAAAILVRIAADYERAVEAFGAALEKSIQADGTIPAETLNSENDE
jgi:hypothetical protein